MKFFLFAIITLIVVGFYFFINPKFGANTKLIITGSSTVAPLALEMAKRFEKQNKGVRIDVQTGGSSRGINDTRNKIADIGMVSRSLKKSESDLTLHTIALDGISIILNSANKVKELSKQQIKDIYLGKINNWFEVGGENQEITVVNKAAGRSTFELFLKYFSLKSSSIQADVIIGDNEQGIKTVSITAGAIGYVSVGAAEYSVKNSVPIKLLPLNGIVASIENIKNGSFPLSRKLNFITKGELTKVQKDFLAFAQSTKVHDLIANLYFVAIN